MFPATTRRVADNSPEEANLRILRRMLSSLVFYATRKDEIAGRLRALDREWDIERVLETNASALSLIGSVLAATVNRKFLALPAAVAAFLLQHALQGWCPPIHALRRLGFRTATEIEQERYALRILRGDFDATSGGPVDRARRALTAIGL